MREREVERYFILRVSQAGGLQRKFVSPGCVGVADRICGFPGGRFAFVELKRPGKKADDHQQREHNRWRRSGILSFVLDTKEAVDVFIDYMTR
jgi:hypothetical protein